MHLENGKVMVDQQPTKNHAESGLEGNRMGRGRDQISIVVAASANSKAWIPEAFDNDPIEALSITDDASDETLSDEESFDDALSRIIRQRSNGVALYSILCISLSMTLLSFFLLFQFGRKVQDRSRQAESVENSIPLYSSEDLCSTKSYLKPLWQELLELQIDVIQNLVHASLFGSAALVAAIRGDVLWLYFSRNVGFFLFPVTFFCFIHDLGAILWSSHDNADGFQIRLFVSFFMAASSGVAFVKNEASCQVVRRMVVQRVKSLAGIPTSDTTFTRYPPFLARNAGDMAKANVLFYGALFAQASNVIYAIVTATQWFALNVECNNSNSGQRRIEGVAQDENTSGDNLLMFEMAYSLAAHQSYLLALIMLASTYPRHFASVGGALLTSGWRLLVATGSLSHIYLHWNGVPRDSFSLLYTSLEMVAMIPIFVAALLLMRDICRSEGKVSGYKPVGSVENIVDEAALNDFVADSEENEYIESRFHCPTLSQIATSDRYSPRQNWGALLLCLGTAALLLEFTVECVAMLRQHFVGTGMAHDVWKWGMHVCSIYLFCAIMSVETPSIYSRTRLLLAIACPVGSLVGVWQLWTLSQYAEDGMDDLWTLLVACLLGLRILCGLTQTLGLIILQDTEPITNVMSDCCKAPDHELASSQGRAKFALYRLYLPTFVAFVVGVALMSNCSEPMISTMIPSESCSATKMDFVLNQNWPGLGLFFHFGMLIVVGAVDGLSTGSPSYRPSLAIACLFAGHVSCLIFVSFAWDVLQTDGWDVLSVPDVIQRMVLFLWMVASGYLFVCLYRHWKLRVLSM
jgi:hypothetical protein